MRVGPETVNDFRTTTHVPGQLADQVAGCVFGCENGRELCLLAVESESYFGKGKSFLPSLLAKINISTILVFDIHNKYGDNECFHMGSLLYSKISSEAQ